ncbi:protein phosphatase 1 regulatory subunit 7 isoform X1 [Coturnix japonica]|uniref:protein phosphatase 1 regulatory subunit 7 isoform X1 n=1 Tax=Coturnix japonica TaxID=93934 RepID=UPI0007772733|nr:protein phosphatase 1 regulatory subunit 7 isoform X1 [Coturnix japonica]
MLGSERAAPTFGNAGLPRHLVPCRSLALLCTIAFWGRKKARTRYFQRKRWCRGPRPAELRPTTETAAEPPGPARPCEGQAPALHYNTQNAAGRAGCACAPEQEGPCRYPPQVHSRGVDKRIESEESEDEGKKTVRLVTDLSQQSLRDEQNGESSPGEAEIPVDMDTISLDPEAEDVDLNHFRIGKIEGFEVLKKVKTLCLRQNLVKRIENLEQLQTLRELDLYDNQIRKIENLETLADLEILDISFNVLRHIEGLDQLTQLKKLFLVNNKISKIENLSNLQLLQMLELGSNRIRVIENIDTLTNLDSLFLGKNKITKLQNLDALTNLTVLSIQSNRLTKIEGLQSLVNLRELYISNNGIEVIEGLENNNKLTMLDIACNRIKKIENISHLTELQEFWMNDNFVESWSDLDELKGAKNLETVYLERNPLQKDPQYRRKIMLTLPSVRQIDATFVRF